MEVVGEEALKRFYTMSFDPAIIPIGVVLFGFLFSIGAFGIARADYTVAVGALVMFGLAVCLSWPNRYGLDEDRLSWHHGFAVNKSVALRDIDRVRPGEGKNGLTINKVEGHWLSVGKKEFFVAADGQAGLIHDLTNGCPHLSQFGYEYRRRVESF